MVRRYIYTQPLLFLFCLFLCVSMEAQENRRTCHVYFEEAGVSWRPDSSILSLANSSLYHVEKIFVNGYASPSGRHLYNIWLSQKRADNVKDSLLKLLPGTEIISAGCGEDWATLTEKLSSTSLDFDEIDLVSSIAISQPVSGRKDRLIYLRGGGKFILNSMTSSSRSSAG